MFRKSLISLFLAVALMALLVAAVGAQGATDDEEPVAPSIEPMGGGIVQAIPLTLTVNVPGLDGEVVTVEVPIVLSLDIQIALGNVLTTTVAVTPTVAVTSTAAVTESEPVAAVTVAPTVAPTATPVPPTPTAAATPTEVAPTPAPVTEREPTAAPVEEEATAVPEEEDDGDDGDAEATPEAEEEPADEPIAILDPDTCSDARSVIVAPTAGEVVSGTLEVVGTARHEIFNYYKLEYQQVGTETGEFAFILDSTSQVENDVLAELDTTELDNGAYVLRLTVVDNTGNFPPQCSVPVEISN